MNPAVLKLDNVAGERRHETWESAVISGEIGTISGEIASISGGIGLNLRGKWTMTKECPMPNDEGNARTCGLL
jgi:hypothetical protein